MDIRKDEQFRAELITKIAEREFSERTGVHQSDLVFCLTKQALRKLEPSETAEHTMLLFSLGYATQRWLTGQDKDVPEKIVDGITVTLDAQTPEGNPWELKATYQSNSKPIEDSIHQIRQVMAQCYVTGTTFGYLTRLEIMGNWKFNKKGEDKLENRRPTLTAFKLSFTQRELDDFWKWLKMRRDLYLGILETKKMLPKSEALASGMNWECGFCEYKGRCK